jgi:hypothetical protein
MSLRADATIRSLQRFSFDIERVYAFLAPDVYAPVRIGAENPVDIIGYRL